MNLCTLNIDFILNKVKNKKKAFFFEKNTI